MSYDRGNAVQLADTKDRAHLLAVVDRIEKLHVQKFYDKWGRTSDTPTEYGGWCNTCGRFDGASCPTIAALTEGTL